MHRVLFEKTGTAIWMSHLDLMRLMQRAFRRAGVLLHHSQGYTPHAYVSMLLPLSVGMESHCEIMEFELDTQEPITPETLNRVLPEGVRVLAVYDSTRKGKELVWMRVRLTLEYDAGVPEQAAQRITSLLSGQTLIVEKRTKRGMEETDVRPLLHTCEITEKENALVLEAVVSAQNPPLNPMLLAAAVERYLPDCKPDFAKCCRLEMLDAAMTEFR